MTNKKTKKEEWGTMKYPLSSKMGKAIKAGGRNPAWQSVDDHMIEEPKTLDQRNIELYDKFINYYDLLNPGKGKLIEHLRPLILMQILKGKQLDHNYFIDIEEVLRVDKK